MRVTFADLQVGFINNCPTRYNTKQPIYYTASSLYIFLPHGSMNHNSILIKFQQDATVCRYLFTAKSLYMFQVSQHPSSGVFKSVTAASGTGLNISKATSLQRGQIGPPDLATLEGSSCTSIMTRTGGCGCSF